MQSQKLPNPSKILLWDRKLQGKPCLPVTEFDDKLRNLVEVLKSTCYEHNGAGLSAPQIGEFLQVSVIHYPRHAPAFAIINPEIDPLRSKGDRSDWEGCLSIPGKSASGGETMNRAKVERHSEIFVTYFTLDRERKEEHITDSFLARVFQHEIDHLRGTFFIERCGDLGREQVIRKFNNFKAHSKLEFRNGFHYY